MSSILLSNPFSGPPPALLAAVAEPSTGAIAPLQPSGSTSNDNAASGGFGSGGNRQEETVALFQAKAGGKWTRPADATGSSIIGAQAAQPALGPDLPPVEMPDILPTAPWFKDDD